MNAKSTSVKVSWFMAVLTAALAACLLCVAQPAHAAEVQSVWYIKKGWDADSRQVVSETSSRVCTPISSDTVNLNGWYYVTSTVANDNRIVVDQGEEANIVLTDGSKLTVKGGIYVPWNSRLNIYGQSEGENAGELICYSKTDDARWNNCDAAIGSNDNTGPNGPITIHGGKVTADTSKYGTEAAGIGAGNTGAGGTITIYDGTIVARGGSCGAGIGGGDADGEGRDGGTITIYGGDIKAYGGVKGAGIGGGEGGNGGTVTIWGGKVYAEGGADSSVGTGYMNGGAGIGSGDNDGSRATTGGTIDIHGGEVEAVGGEDGAGIGGGDGCIGGLITITGGTVKASSNGYGSGIGAGDDTDGKVNASIINITGGTVETTGGAHGAGIGGGEGGGGGNIFISGGTVTANAGYNGAGIGGGDGGNGDNITISGGTVTANASANTGNASGAGIGGGKGGAGTTIVISGGHVDATGSAYGAGIGNGQDGTGMATTITLKYADASRDISVKANSYRYNDGDTSVTVKMENLFMDKDTKEGFAVANYTGNDLNQFKNKTLVCDNTHTITVSGVQFGTVVPDMQRAVPQETVTLTVTPNAGWRLKNNSLKVTAGETEIAVTRDASDRSKYTFTMPDADVTVTAGFELSFIADTIWANPGSATLAVGETKTLTVTTNPDFVAEYDEFADTLTWTSSDESIATVDSSGKVTAVAPGTVAIVVATTNGTADTADDRTATCTVTVPKLEVEAPTIASKVYNGESQTADIEASELYDVTSNEGGTNAGEYDVVLTLKDPDTYKWSDSDASSKILKFEITKAQNKVSVSLEGWACNEQANDPVVEADYGADTATFEYKAKDAEDEAYSADAPTEPGDYTVRATIAESTNYLAASATANFTISGPVMVTLTLVGSSIDGEDAFEPYVVSVPKGSSVDDLDNDIYDDIVTYFTKGVYVPYYEDLYVISQPLSNFDNWRDVEDEDDVYYSKALSENTTLYVPLGKAIDSIELSVEVPVCGTDMATSKPAVAMAEGSLVKVSPRGPIWVDTEAIEEIASGTIAGGTTYGVEVEFVTDEFGYFLTDSTDYEVTVVGADEGSVVKASYGVYFTVTAEHDWGAATYTWSNDNKKVTATRTCKADASHKETETVNTTAAVTKATFAAAGKIAYTATFKNTAFKTQTKDVAIPKLTVSGVVGKAYTGKAITQNLSVKSGNTTLKANTDYTLSYKNNVNVGTATVTVTAKGTNYTGSVNKTFKIKSWKRLYGSNAIKTMEQITKEYGKATTAVVATNADFKDSLAAAALAGSYSAPMLTTGKASLAEQTKSELKRMGVKTVYLIGSTTEVSANTEKQIKALGITVKRVQPTAAKASSKSATSAAPALTTSAASNAPAVASTQASAPAASAATLRAIECAKLVKNRSDTVIIATQNNFKDALAISSYAYATKSPILYAETNKALAKETIAYIKSAKFKKAIIVGGPVALPKDIETQLKSAGITAGNISRLAGSNQYKTAQVIAEWATGKLKNGTGGSGLYQYASIKFQPAVKMSANKLGVARAEDNKIGWKDALAGAALCGKNKSVLILADVKNSAAAEAFVKANKASIQYGYVFGGTSAVPKAVMDKLVNASL